MYGFCGSSGKRQSNGCENFLASASNIPPTRIVYVLKDHNKLDEQLQSPEKGNLSSPFPLSLNRTVFISEEAVQLK